MESNPDFSDNTKALFDKMIEKKYNEKYKIVWIVDNKNIFENVNIKNVKFINKHGNIFNNIKYKYYRKFAKIIIDCNKYIKKCNKHQFRIYLTHGEFIKIPWQYAQQMGEVDYIVQTSDFFNSITCKAFNVNQSQILITGYPRNDYLFKDNNKFFSIKSEGNIKNRKIILWLPTYRNHKSYRVKKIEDPTFVMNIDYPYGVPVINNIEEFNALNTELSKYNVLLLIKPHPAEDTSKISNLKLSNIRIIDDSIFEEKHTNLYQLLSITDAMITDYSSVYYDYLLTDKPIGLAASDLNEYVKHIDILFNDYKKGIVGEYINNLEDLKKFIKDVANGNDTFLQERIIKKKLYHKFYDGNSSERVLKLIEIKMNNGKIKENL